MNTLPVFHLNFAKALQATAIVLRTEGGEQMNYMKLLKLLYIADREALGETGRPITGDRGVAMKRGLLLSGIYDIIKGEHLKSGEWEQYISKSNFTLHLIDDPGRRHLSKYEIEKLQNIAKRHENDDEWDMVEFTHGLPEWKKIDPGDSSRVVPLRDILDALGRLNDEESIVEDARVSRAFDQFFASHRQ